MQGEETELTGLALDLFPLSLLLCSQELTHRVQRLEGEIDSLRQDRDRHIAWLERERNLCTDYYKQLQNVSVC